MIEEMPSLTSESMTAGESWGQKLGPELELRVNAILKSRDSILDLNVDRSVLVKYAPGPTSTCNRWRGGAWTAEAAISARHG
jgi:hypothetical protein